MIFVFYFAQPYSRQHWKRMGFKHTSRSTALTERKNTQLMVWTGKFEKYAIYHPPVQCPCIRERVVRDLDALSGQIFSNWSVTFLPVVAMTQYSNIVNFLPVVTMTRLFFLILTTHIAISFFQHMKNLILFYVCSDIHPGITENSQTSN